ncbi:Unknown protein, partial [Striga hermonthica]
HSAHHQRISPRPRPVSSAPHAREDLRRQIERNRLSRHSAEEIETLRKRLAELETRQKSQEDSPRHVTTSGNVIIEADSPLAPELTAEALPAKLRAAFRSHFIGAQICLIPKESITNIVQKDDETVKDYVSRFNDRIQNMEPCHPETLLVTAIAGLKPNSMFRWTLCQNKPATFQEFLVRAQQFIIAEESMSVLSFDFSVKESKTEPDAKKKHKKNFGKAQFRNSSKGYENTPESRAARDQYSDNVKTGYHVVYSAGAATIYEELKGKGIIPDPRPVRTPEDKLDKTRYCAYHKSPGHNTDECLGLLSALLRLIGQPQLQKFRNFDNRRKGRPLDLSDDEEDDNRPVNQKRARANDKEVFAFSTHVGTPTDNCRKSRIHDTLDSSHCIPRVNSNNKQLDTSRRKVKAYAREAQNAEKRVMNVDLRDTINKRNCPITFSIEDANLFAHPHSDALIITAPIGGIPVHRILVDTRAYSSILMLRT